MVNPNKLGRSPFPAGASQWMLVGLRGGTVTPPTNNLLSNLISYWKLDFAPGSVTPDAQGTNHLSLGTTGGSNPALASGLINNGMLFTAANQGFLSDSNNATLQVTSDFTWSCWLKLTTNAASAPIIYKGVGSAGSLDYEVYHHPSAGFVFSVNDNATIAVAVGTPQTTGVWVHVVAWWDSADSKLRLRINDTTTYVSTMTGTLVQTGNGLNVGRDTAATIFLDGLLDEVGFWKRKLTAGEITALYNGGAGLPYSSFT